MNKQPPSIGRVLTMVLFALSCFGLLLFLWLSFGGSIPLAPKGYRVRIAFPQATQLANQADVRVAGIDVGKVVSLKLDPKGNRTMATIQLDSQYAPLHRDAQATLRLKTLLGETYVELTRGHASAGDIPDGGLLARSHVADTVQFDQVLSAFDPQTRQAFRQWQRYVADAIRGNGRNLNDVLGNLPTFAGNASQTLDVLDVEHVALRRLVRDTGTVFASLSRDPAQLRNLITNSEAVFRQTAAQNRALEATFHVFPTFLDESKATLARLQTFATNTDPLVRELRPVARDLRPTLADVKNLSPYLRQLFANLGPLITVSQTGLPALSRVLRGANPLLAQVPPFLSQLNPVLQYLELNQHLIADFMTIGATGLGATTASASGGIGHYLRQLSPITPESLSVYPQRAATNRANPYLPPLAMAEANSARYQIYPVWDCNNTGGTHKPTSSAPGCWTTSVVPSFQGRHTKFPRVAANPPAGK